MPELPADRARRFQAELGLSADSAQRLAFRSDLGDYFELAHSESVEGAPAQVLANWVDELAGRLDDVDPGDSRVSPASLAGLVGMLGRREVTVGAARQVLDRLVAEGGDPAEIVASEGLGAMSGDDGELEAVVAAAIESNPDAAERIRAGNDKAIGPIIGHVMRETKGRADGGEVTRLVREQLGL